MKFFFICGSLQAGSDGVGDYVRRLACMLIANGHQVNAVALKDHHLAVHEDTVQQLNGIQLPVLRLPATLSSRERYRLLSKKVKSFSPDIISLQYVGFGFQKYGLPFEMLSNFRKAVAGVKLHIMLHELWCGMAVNAGFKEKVLGNLQKRFLKTLITSLKPQHIFTSISPYHDYLKQIQVEADVVPIFGNIPTNEFGDDKEWQQFASSKHLSLLTGTAASWLVVGFFGTSYNCPGLKEMIETVNIAATQAGLKLGVLLIGHSRVQNVADILKTIPGAVYWQTGSVPAPMINRCMQLVDAGIVTSPVDGINKSGAAIAWMERGIPVLISASDKTYHEADMKKLGIFQASSVTNVIEALHAKGKIIPQNYLNQAAEAYLECI
ncbi:glycosyltransferase [Mucilaginibacter sp. UR6-1]|uniref:glycosyltransferase n=1 Tax=Mucilaginibacter sp. UR6-1 TaxID=1435643 RepID=UPI001E37A36E|nr:glycosyltransferase [Mucilaginibacter sp. UR6-1]MCC8408167.1 glycosyltransferase [Mucilaginibacter sp. UR6-1]